MLTIHQMAERTGVTIRALRYYDKIGLLPPGAVSPAGYRLYGPAELDRLQQILFFRELEFPLAEIKAILASPAYDRTAALTAQRALLRAKRDRLDGLLSPHHPAPLLLHQADAGGTGRTVPDRPAVPGVPGSMGDGNRSADGGGHCGVLWGTGGGCFPQKIIYCTLPLPAGAAGDEMGEDTGWNQEPC